MERQIASQATSTPAGLLLRLHFRNPAAFRRLEGVVESGRLLVTGAGASLGLSAHRVDLDVRGGPVPDLFTEIPAGTYSRLVLDVRSLRLLDPGGRWREVASGEPLRVPLDLRVGAGETVVVSLEVDVSTLGRRRGGLVRAVSSRAEIRRPGIRHVVPGDQPYAARLSLATSAGNGAEAVLRVPRRALPTGGIVTLSGGGGEDRESELPQLLRAQRRVGPAIEINLDAAPHGPLELTIPYDPALTAQAGIDPHEIVVLQLDDERTRYRELRPRSIDPGAAALTVDVASTSTFMACTAGIRIDEPELIVNAGGEVVSYRPDSPIAVAGQVADAGAAVGLVGAPFSDHWVHDGWFAFRDVPLGAVDTVLTIQAVVEGLVAHECEVRVRRLYPRKLVTQPGHSCGNRLAFLGDGRACVTTVARVEGRVPNDDGTASDEETGPNLAGWQRSLDRQLPMLHVADHVTTVWQPRRLLENTFFENEIARLAIRGLEDSGDRVTLDANAPEPIRYLRSLEAHISTPPAGTAHTPLGPVTIDEAYRRLVLVNAAARFSVRDFTVSPVAPIVPLDEDSMGVAYVRATVEGLDARAATSLGAPLSVLYAIRMSEDGETRTTSEVLIGDLVLATATAAGIRDAQVVADGIWAASIAAVRNPTTGQPALLALAAEPDGDDGPRCGLVLFQRGADGTWARETVWEGRPIVDADLTFDFAGRPHVVAATSSRVPHKGHLVALRREATGWSASPVVYTLDGLPGSSDVGMWPRLATDRHDRPILSFTVDAGVGVVWVVGPLDGGPTDFRRLATANAASVFGISSAPIDELFPPGVADQTGLSFAHFASSITRGADGRVWLAYGPGTARLAEVETEARGVAFRDYSVDVDRSAGFFPSVAVRGSVPAFVYKDRFGRAPDAPDAITWQPDLHYFALELGNLVPVEPGFRLVPGIERTSVVLDSFGPRVPLTRDVFQGLLGLSLVDLITAIGGSPTNLLATASRPFLPTLLLNSTISLTLIPESGGNPGFDPLELEYSHPSVAAILRRLPARPNLLELTLVNDSPSDELTRLSFTVIGALFELAGSMAASLDSGGAPAAAVRTAFQDAGITLDPGARVRVLTPGSRWAITERVTPSAIEGTFRRWWLIRAGGNRLGVSLPPLVTAVAQEDERDPTTNQRTPLGIPTPTWDVLGVLAQDFTANLPSLPSELGLANVIRLSGIRLSYRGETHAPGQQGLVRFRLSIRDIYAEGQLFTAKSVDPSSLDLTISPHVFDGALLWRRRTTNATLGSIDVDTKFGGFLRTAAAVLTGDPLLNLEIQIDVAAESYLTSRVNERRELEVGGLPGLLMSLFEDYVRSRFPNGEPPPLEAVYLRDLALSCLSCAPIPTRVSVLAVTPDRIVTFGAVRAGDSPIRRNILLQATGELAVLVRDLVLRTEDGEFSVVAPDRRQRVIPPGGSEIITVQLAARAPTDLLENHLDISYNLDETASVRLAATVLAGRQPAARVSPAALAFGLVPVGGSRDRAVDVFNDGDGPLQLGQARIEADPGELAVFSLTFATPITVEAQQSHRLIARFRPTAAVLGGHSARLVVDTNDPNRPVLRVPMTGTGFAARLYLSPERIDFGGSAIASAASPGPGVPRAVTIANTGVADLTIEGASFQLVDPGGATSPHFGLFTTSGVPMTQTDVRLRGGEQLGLIVRFRPTAIGDHAASLAVRSDDPSQPLVTVTVTGRGV